MRHLLLFGATLLAVGCGSDDPVNPGPAPGPDNRAPNACFTPTPANIPAGDNNQTVVTLDGSLSSDPDGDPLAFQWTVPSGTFVQSTSASSEVPKVTFPGAAPYDVTLRVTDPAGLSDQATMTVGITSPPTGGNQAPTAFFTASPANVPAGDGNQTVVTLNGSGSSDPDGDPLTYQWTVPGGTFVSGTSASSVSPRVTFPGIVPYFVTLLVRDPSGATGTFSFTVGIG